MVSTVDTPYMEILPCHLGKVFSAGLVIDKAWDTLGAREHSAKVQYSCPLHQLPER